MVSSEHETILNALPVPALLCRADRIIASNPPFRDLLGLTSGDYAGASVESVVSLDTAPTLAPAPAHGCPGHLRLPDGGSVAVLWNQEWFPDDTNEQLLIFTDDRERQALWRQLASTDRLAQAGLLTAGTAHEIQNLLAYARLTLEELAPHAEDDDQEEAFTELRGTLYDILSLVQGLRDVARPPSGAEPPGRAKQELERAIALASHTIKSHATIISTCTDDAELTLPEQALRQVMLNLLLNAGQAIIRGGTAGTIHITSERRDGAVVMSVLDNGSGIASEDESHLFDPYFTTRDEGTGMGLYVSRALVRSHGGTLTLENAPGGGALATLTVPLATSPALASTERRASPRFRADGISGVLEAGELRTPVTLVDFSTEGLRLSGLSLSHLDTADRIVLHLSVESDAAPIVQSQVTMVRRVPTPKGDDLCFRITGMSPPSRSTWQRWLSATDQPAHGA